jgi:hypothetical protein
MARSLRHNLEGAVHNISEIARAPQGGTRAGRRTLSLGRERRPSSNQVRAGNTEIGETELGNAGLSSETLETFFVAANPSTRTQDKA